MLINLFAAFVSEMSFAIPQQGHRMDIDIDIAMCHATCLFPCTPSLSLLNNLNQDVIGAGNNNYSTKTRLL